MHDGSVEALRAASAASTARFLSAPPAPSGRSRPRILFQKWNDRSCVPDIVFTQARQLANGYEHVLFDDADSDRFICERFGGTVAQRYANLTNKAHKADLLRYGLLYLFGGVYLDVDTPLILPLDEVFPDENISYTVRSFLGGIAIGVLASPPGLQIYQDALTDMVHTETHAVEQTYTIFTKHFDTLLKKSMRSSKEGGWALHRERCLHRRQRNDSLSQCAGAWEPINRWGYCCWFESGEGRVLMGKNFNDYQRPRVGRAFSAEQFKDFVSGPCANAGGRPSAVHDRRSLVKETRPDSHRFQGAPPPPIPRWCPTRLTTP